MSALFSKPKIPAAPAPKELPREDDEAARKAKIKQYAALAKDAGRESTRLGQTNDKLGNYAPPQTRGGMAVLQG